MTVSLVLLWESPCAIRTHLDAKDIADNSETEGPSKDKVEAHVPGEGTEAQLKEEATAEKNPEADPRQLAHHNLLELNQTADISTLLKAVQVSDNTTGHPRVELPAGWSWVKKLGNGAFGEVWSVCVDRSCSAKNALKVIPASKASSVAEEVRLQKQVQPNDLAVKVTKDWTDSKHNWMIALELLPDGDLEDHLPELQSGRSKYKAHLIFHDLIDGLEMIHEKGVMHGDIKPENIFCDANPSSPPGVSPVACKWGDFGLAQAYTKGAKTLSIAAGTPLYASPEIWQASRKRYEGREVDVWAMGVLLFNMLTGGEAPFLGNSIAELSYKIMHTEPPYHLVTVESARWLVEKMLQKDPKKRFSLLEITQSCYYYGYKKGGDFRGCRDKY